MATWVCDTDFKTAKDEEEEEEEDGNTKCFNNQKMRTGEKLTEARSDKKKNKKEIKKTKNKKNKRSNKNNKKKKKKKWDTVGAKLIM